MKNKSIFEIVVDISYRYSKFIYIRFRNLLKRNLSRNISSKSLIGPGVQILGIDNMVIEDNCTIGENTLFTINNRDVKDIQLHVRKNSYIGRDCFFSVGKSIIIKEYCIFGNKCSFVCSDHIFNSPMIPYALSGNTYGKSIMVGVNCWFGHDVSIIGNVTIGHGSIIGAKSIVTKDVPPFSMVVGNPGKIVKTFNFSSMNWEPGEHKINSEYLDEAIYLNYLTTNSKDLPLLYYSASSSFGDL